MELVYFTAPWCVPCRQFGPVMDEVQQNVKVRKVDVDQSQEQATAFAVMSVPTVVAVKDNKELGRFSGARDLQFVQRFIASHQS